MAQHVKISGERRRVNAFWVRIAWKTGDSEGSPGFRDPGERLGVQAGSPDQDAANVL